MDWNMWHLSHEGDDLEDPANAPHKDMFLVTCDPEDAPDKPELVTIEFEKGIPTALNGKKLGGIDMINELNAIGARNGIGIDDIVENRLVGMKPLLRASGTGTSLPRPGDAPFQGSGGCEVQRARL